MDTASLKKNLVNLGDEARAMTNHYTGIALAIAYLPESDIRDLLDKNHGAGGIQEIIGRLRIDMAGALDKAFAMILEETRAQAVRIEQSKRL